MHRRSIVLLVLSALAFVLAYWFYYEGAVSEFFDDPSGTLTLIAAIFLTGALLSWPAHGHGHHEHHEAHGHKHSVHAHAHDEPAEQGRQG